MWFQQVRREPLTTYQTSLVPELAPPLITPPSTHLFIKPPSVTSPNLQGLPTAHCIKSKLKCLTSGPVSCSSADRFPMLTSFQRTPSTLSVISICQPQTSRISFYLLPKPWRETKRTLPQSERMNSNPGSVTCPLGNLGPTELQSLHL